MNIVTTENNNTLFKQSDDLTTENPSCAVCYEDFTKLTRAQIDCPACDVKSCRTCVRNYLLQSSELPHCMHCKNRWERDFLTKATLKSFVNGDYRKHRTKLLFEIEKSRMPETMPAIENYQKVSSLTVEREHVKENLTALREQLYLMKLKESNLCRQIKEYSEGKSSGESKREFKRACPRNDCLGFLSSAWKCGVCNYWACSKCFEVKGLHKDEPHVCDPNVLASAQLLKKDTKPCPSCASSIYKIDGCDQMWCTQCHIAFSWKTGRKVNGVVHNPHFYHWQNNGAEQAPVQTPGAILCGGFPNWRILLNNMRIFNNELILNKNLIDKAKRLYRGGQHFHHWVINRLREQCQNIEDNTALRIRYAVKEITEEELKSQLIRRDKIKSKRRSILEVYELVNVVFTESLRDISEWLRENVETMENMEALRKIHFKYEVEELFIKNFERCDKVRIYANDELKKISVLYSQKVDIIKEDFYTQSVKFTSNDI